MCIYYYILFNYLPVNICAVVLCVVIMSNAAMEIGVQISEFLFSVLWDIYPQVIFLDHMII